MFADNNITFPVPGEDDHTVEVPQETTEDEGWKVPDELEFPAADDAAEAEDEAKQADEVPADEEEPEDEETEEPAAKSDEDWDGRIESIPEEYRPYVLRKHKDMERGFHAKMRQVAELQKEYEAKLEKVAAPPPAPEAGPPPMPGDNASPEEWNRAWEARMQYEVDKKVQQQISEKLDNVFPKLDEQTAKMQQYEARERYNRLTQKEGFSPEVEQRMTELVEANPLWQQALQSDEGLDALFDHAALQVGRTQRAEKTARRKASASKRAVPRSQETGAPKEVTPAERYGTTLEQDGMEVAKELGLSW